MKKLALTLCLSALATATFAQGTVNFLNGPTTLVRTNSSGMPGGQAGATSLLPNGFFFAIYTAPSTITSASAGDLSSWTFAGIYGANTVATTGGRFTGGGNVATTTGWAPGVTNSYMVLGWSAGLAGQNAASVVSKLNGATLSGGVWRGGNFSSTDEGQFVGISAVGFGAAGGGASGLPPFSLFGSTPTAQGTPIPTGFDLFYVNVPEPSTMALAGLGAAALVIFRRRKV